MESYDFTTFFAIFLFSIYYLCVYPINVYADYMRIYFFVNISRYSKCVGFNVDIHSYEVQRGCLGFIYSGRTKRNPDLII